MIDILGFVDKILSAISITKSASDLNDELDQSKSKTDFKNRDEQEAVAKQRYDSMKSTREGYAEHEDDDQLQQKR